MERVQSGRGASPRPPRLDGGWRAALERRERQGVSELGLLRRAQTRKLTRGRRCLWGRVRWGVLVHSLDYQLGTPRERYDEHNSKFSLNKKPRFNRSVGERNHFWRLMLTGFWQGHYRHQKQRGTCTQHNQDTLPQLAVRLSILLVCWKQRIKRIMWKRIFACSK
jgi:hypothetical protein